MMKSISFFLPLLFCTFSASSIAEEPQEITTSGGSVLFACSNGNSIPYKLKGYIESDYKKAVAVKRKQIKDINYHTSNTLKFAKENYAVLVIGFGSRFIFKDYMPERGNSNLLEQSQITPQLKRVSKLFLDQTGLPGADNPKTYGLINSTYEIKQVQYGNSTYNIDNQHWYTEQLTNQSGSKIKYISQENQIGGGLRYEERLIDKDGNLFYLIPPANYSNRLSNSRWRCIPGEEAMEYKLAKWYELSQESGNGQKPIRMEDSPLLLRLAHIKVRTKQIILKEKPKPSF